MEGGIQMIVWIEPNSYNYVTVRASGINFSVEAYNNLSKGNGVAVGIDEEKKLMVLKATEKVGYRVSGGDKSKRIYSKDLGDYLKSKGVIFKKYQCTWNETEGLLTAKY